MAYVKTAWVNDSPPPINASNLNKIEDGIESNDIAIASITVELGSTIAYASTLFNNIAVNASAIADNASDIAANTAAIASVQDFASDIGSLVDTQTAAIASNTVAVATLLPQVATHTEDISVLYATQGAQATQIADLEAGTGGAVASSLTEILATQGAQATQIDELIASQTGLIATQGAQASEIQDLQDSIGVLDTEVTAGLVDNTNQFGLGPIDYWDAIEPINITASSEVPVARYVQYIPVATIGAASGVQEVTVDILSNAGIASPTLEISAAIMDDTGTILSAASAISIPSIATTSIVETVALPLNEPSFVFDPGAKYFIAISTDDLYRSAMLGLSAGGEAQAVARHLRGITHELVLPSGVDLTFYSSLPVDIATTVAPDAYPAPFVTE